MGTGLGIFYGVSGGAALLAGVWAGLAWGSAGRLPLIVSGSVTAVLAVVLAAGGGRLTGSPVDQASGPSTLNTT